MYTSIYFLLLLVYHTHAYTTHNIIIIQSPAFSHHHPPFGGKFLTKHKGRLCVLTTSVLLVHIRGGDLSICRRHATVGS